MKTITLYKVGWSNEHASGVFKNVFRNKKDATNFARDWKWEMVHLEKTPKERKEAKQEYQWFLVSQKFWAEKDRNGAWMIFDKAECPRQPVVKDSPYKLAVRGLVSFVERIDAAG